LPNTDRHPGPAYPNTEKDKLNFFRRNSIYHSVQNTEHFDTNDKDEKKNNVKLKLLLIKAKKISDYPTCVNLAMGSRCRSGSASRGKVRSGSASKLCRSTTPQKTTKN
jgi:hypothetical protein